jgi:FSR family fosmidomycin resistance protein-like MFS transporter
MFSTSPVLIVAAQELVPKSRTLVSSMMMGLGWGVGSLLVPVTGLLGDIIGLEKALQWVLVLSLIGVILIALGVKDHGVKDHRECSDSP